ncbi:MAG: ABC transporter permease [Acidobacteria bacterium]|nr:ABC transporter permease [Acidobacteriota bacterium]
MPTLADLRHAFRLLARSPVFTATAVLSMALGIAAASTIFTLTDALLFAPTAGVRNAGEVVDIGRGNQGSGFDNMSHPAFVYLRDHTQTLAGMAAVNFSGGPMSLGENGGSERIIGTLVSGNYFDVLGTRAALGRFFRPDEDAVPGERPVAVLTHDFWMRRFGGDPRILQRTLRINNREFSVVGVAEPGFKGSSLVGTDVWVPMAMVAVARGLATSDLLTEVRGVWHVAIGRLKPGVSRAQALAELNTLMEQYKASQPLANPRHTVAIEPTSRVPGPVRTPFLGFVGLLFALTGALVAIACSNVAGMLMARAATRRREIATRLALGASRGRLLMQLFTETTVLFAMAGLAAVPLIFWLVSLLEGFRPALPFDLNLHLAVNLRVVLFAMGIALATALTFGLAPARQALRGDVAPALHGVNATVDRRRFRLRHGLVVAQVALSLMLVVTAVLFLRTLRNAASVDPGFTTANIQLASLDVGLSGFREQRAVDLIGRMQARVAGISGVTSVAAGRMIPLQGGSLGLGRIRIPGRQAGPEGSDVLDADWNVVSPEYFETIGMRVVEGRGLLATDRADAPMAAVVNETFARTAWPGQPAIGQRFMQQTRDSEERPVEVVGVVVDAKYRYVTDPPTPFVFVPLAQQPMTDMTLFVRHAEGRQVAQEIRAAVAQVESSVPVMFLQSFEDAAAIGLVPQRVAAWIAGGVGTMGVFLAALGLYGLMAFLVTQRTREIAIRMALGASTVDVHSMVMKQAAWLGASGGIIGLLLAAAVGTLMQSLLVGVPPADPVSFGFTAALFAVVLAAACWSPARRASRTDPAVALRAE